MSASSAKEIYDILVIEDNPGDFYLIREYIEEQFESGKLHHVTDYYEAEKALNNGDHNFDAILLDLTLPDLSGEELIKKVTSLEGDAVTIALTGYSDMEFSVKSLAMGVSDYLLKDELTPNGLWKSIRYSLERNAVLESLKESEERYRDLFQNNPNPLLVWKETSGQILDVNKKAIEQYGYSIDEFRKRTISSIMKEKVQAKELNKNEVHLHQKNSGETFSAEITNHSIDFDGTNACLTIVDDVSDKLELQEKIIESSIQAEETERNRIASELHDGIVQQLVACGMFTQNLAEKVEGDKELSSDVDRLYNLLIKTTIQTRNISHNLRSAEFVNSSLSDLLQQLIGQLNSAGNIKFVFNNYLNYDAEYNISLKTNTYRLVQELCNNIFKHSRANRAVLTIEEIGGVIYLTVKDDGEGFNYIASDLNGLGLKNVENRIMRLGGKIEFCNVKEGGFQVDMEFPANNLG